MRTLLRFCALALGLLPVLAPALPQIGDRLPDVTAFDEEGKAFPLREKLKGKPVVIVFGCLT